MRKPSTTMVCFNQMPRCLILPNISKGLLQRFSKPRSLEQDLPKFPPPPPTPNSLSDAKVSHHNQPVSLARRSLARGVRTAAADDSRPALTDCHVRGAAAERLKQVEGGIGTPERS